MESIGKNLTVDVPCRIGDTVYKIIMCKTGYSHIQQFTCCGFHIIEAPSLRGHERKSYIIVHLEVTNSISHIPFDKINKTVFFNKEEAEQKIKGADRR